MTTRVICDPDSLARQGVLLAGLEEAAAEWMDRASRAHQQGDIEATETYLTLAYTGREVARRVRARLVALSGLTEGDVAVSGGLADLMQCGDVSPAGPADSSWQPPTPFPHRVPVQSPGHLTPEPPAKLGDLYRWLRNLLGHLFPWVSSEQWQRVAWTLLQDRGRHG